MLCYHVDCDCPLNMPLLLIVRVLLISNILQVHIAIEDSFIPCFLSHRLVILHAKWLQSAIISRGTPDCECKYPIFVLLRIPSSLLLYLFLLQHQLWLSRLLFRWLANCFVSRRAVAVMGGGGRLCGLDHLTAGTSGAAAPCCHLVPTQFPRWRDMARRSFMRAG